MNPKDIFDLSLSKREIALMGLNTFSTVVIRTSSLISIFDPIEITADQCSADVIVITHEHYDHFDAKLVAELQKHTGAIILTTPFIANKLRKSPINKIKTLKIGDSFVIKEVEFYAMFSDHFANQPLSFMITVENSIRIYHPDDSRAFPAMEKLGEKYKPDILLYLGASLKKGTNIAKLIRPKIIIRFDLDTTVSKRFSEIINKEIPEINVVTMRPLELYIFHR